MILFPSVDKLLERVDSRYSLIMLASKRAHEIDKYRIDKWRGAPPGYGSGALAHPDKAGETVSLEGDKPLLLDHYDSNKSVGMALEEIEAGLVTIDPDQHEDLQD